MARGRWQCQLKLTRISQQLLACLLLERNHWRTRDVLADILWSDHSQRQAQICLNTSLCRLHKALDADLHLMLRRWDHKELNTTEQYPAMADDGALKLGESNWLVLESGIQIYFDPAQERETHTYRTGDYWLIPTRTATGEVAWPGPVDDPDELPPIRCGATLRAAGKNCSRRKRRCFC